MMRLPMSDAAGGLFRALIARAGVARDRILLSHYRTTDWQSLTFVGERHRFQFRIPGPDAELIGRRMTEEIDEAEFTVPNHIVADVALVAPLERHSDGSITADIEALTIAE
jgi:hypothetical protein